MPKRPYKAIGTIAYWQYVIHSTYFWWMEDQVRIKKGMLPTWKSPSTRYKTIEKIELRNLTDDEIFRMGEANREWQAKLPIE